MGSRSSKSEDQKVTAGPPARQQGQRLRTNAEYRFFFKIMIVGNSSVGKSSLLLRFVDDIFTDVFILTIGADFKSTVKQVGDDKVKLNIFDVAGQEGPFTIQSYYRGISAAIICYDITRHDTFTGMEYWLNQVERYAPTDTLIVLVACKGDLENQRAVPTEEAAEFCNRRNLQHFTTSAQTGSGVTEVFSKITSDLIEKL